MPETPPKPEKQLMKEATSDEQFVQEVFPAELEEIAARRRELKIPSGRIDRKLNEHSGKPKEDAQWILESGWVRSFFDLHSVPISKEAQIDPSPDFGLSGLALSGGGIRSASLNLGILQGLFHRRLLREVDYLSTVSGGGYIGSTLTAELSVPGKNIDEDFHLRRSQGLPECKAFQHLRSFSNYLVPGGLLDRIRIPALMLRGILINLVLVVPWLALLAALTVWFYGDDLAGCENGNPSSCKMWFQYMEATPVLLFLLVIGVFNSPWIQKYSIWSSVVGWLWPKWYRVKEILGRKPANPQQSVSLLRRRGVFESTFAFFLILLAVSAFIELQPFLIQEAGTALNQPLKFPLPVGKWLSLSGLVHK